MLTEAQLAARRLVVGASEAAALAGVDPMRTALDVWATKRRGHDLQMPPLVAEPPPEPDKPIAVALRIDTDARDLGNILEGAIADAYALRTGHELVASPGSLVDEEEPCVGATPDRLVRTSGPESFAIDGGLEVKLVGEWMAKHWPGDGIAPYVECQVQQCMGVTGLPWWDVVALIGGTDLRIVRVERDDVMIADLRAIARAFWRDHILANVMPSSESGDARIKLMSAIIPQDNGETLAAEGKELAALARELYFTQRIEKLAKDRAKLIKSHLCRATGPYKSLKGDWGRFSWATTAGSTQWRAVAEDLSGGVIPEEVILAHKSPDYRKPMLYASKALKADQDLDVEMALADMFDEPPTITETQTEKP
jgi:predicted phage-related endonuclease